MLFASPHKLWAKGVGEVDPRLHVGKHQIIQGSSINDVTGVGGGSQGFCVNCTKVSIIKSVTMGEGGSKNVIYCVTSFMDDPLLIVNPLGRHL